MHFFVRLLTKKKEMESGNIMAPKCPIELTLSLINGKWKIKILKELSQGALRYGEIVKGVPGVSAKVLIQQLREMEEEGIIIRTVFPEIPPRVEYAVSEKGLSIYSIFVEMRRWGLELSENDEVGCAMCMKCQPHIANMTA